ncbi:hypothetical protein DTO027B5_1690 [Paecilomyces variotii]|nr:hypothetical protein DTO027B3_1232 [Paecilomyces variotii]KAJ9336375.1 hypothetical protein DTO027B5_1690 [Paecilomyces variotii]
METRTETGLLSPFSPMFGFAKRNADIQDSKVKDEFSESSLSSIDSEIFSTPENINTENIIWRQELCSGSIRQGAQPIPLRLADNLLLMIKEWHGAYPKHIPPAALRVRDVSRDWRVFDKNGEKASMSVLEFSSPLRYKMLVLHVSNAADRFVAVVYNQKGVSFYKAWLYGNTYDTEICAIRVHDGHSENVFGSASLRELLLLAREKLPTRNASSSAAALPKDLIQANTTPLPVGMGSEEIHHVLQRDRNVRDSVRDSAANAFDSDHTSAKPRRSTRTKKGVKKAVSKPCETADESCFPIGKVIMRLVAQNPEITRCFPLDVCRTSSELFERATTFFRLLDKKVHVDVLSCSIAAGAERRYLFKGANEEFTIFVEDLKDLANRSTEKLTISVFCVR